ncbi:DUF2017 domain-containing protein [Microbacterium lacus]|uniref:DUF2017 family protein n=1 Tax=Microbacterium lacus TaxID=415217 RepID=UPI0038507367
MTRPLNPTITLDIARIEASHLSGLVGQFAELLEESQDSPRGTADPAVLRLVPDAYEDVDDAREFRDVTESDLLGRRQTDAAVVLASLSQASAGDIEVTDAAFAEMAVVTLDDDQAHAWLRTLSAIRLVLATRLGIADVDEHDEDDPRFGIYDWLGFRLDTLVAAVESLEERR